MVSAAAPFELLHHSLDYKRCIVFLNTQSRPESLVSPRACAGSGPPWTKVVPDDSEQISAATIAHHTVYEKTRNFDEVSQKETLSYLTDPLSRLVGRLTVSSVL